MKTTQKLSARRPESNSHKKLEETRVMNKSNGVVKAYSANTFQGLVRNYNQDRVSIILNISKPQNQNNWPKCSYFGVFDGHGGCLCSDFLRDNLHKFIIQDKNFPFKPLQALKNGFIKAENQFIKLAESLQPVDKSGSCAIIALIINDTCYIANVGDSRAILSYNKGLRVSALSNDHKPNSKTERERIQKFGGTIYQSNIVNKKGETYPGPHRILPGRLSVSRAIGDIYAKLQKYEGNPNVLIAQPEIKQFHFDSTSDFILLGCDGIFDRLSNQQIVDLVWMSKKETESQGNFLKQAISAVIQQSMLKKSLDNLTAVLVLVECDDNQPKKSSSSANLKSSSTLKIEGFNQQKLRTCTKEELLKISKVQNRRRPSMELNKQNSNTNNLGYLSNLQSKNLFQKNSLIALQLVQKQKMVGPKQKEKQKSDIIKQKSQKDILKSKKKLTQSKKLQFTKYQQLTRKNISDLMRS